MSLKTKTENITLNSTDNLSLSLTVEMDNGNEYDTRVQIEGGTLCWVSGPERHNFINELNELIAKYRI